MPLHDYHCEGCHKILQDQYRSIEVGAAADPPYCDPCHRPMSWIPQVGRMDLLFEAFDTFDGRNHPVHIDSLHKLRKVEAEAERMTRNGEGQPMVWRKYSQDRSNTLDHTLLKQDPTEAPDPAYAQRLGIVRHGESVPDLPFGPAVSESNASALKG